jgi:hypothetical protein
MIYARIAALEAVDETAGIYRTQEPGTEGKG